MFDIGIKYFILYFITLFTFKFNIYIYFLIKRKKDKNIKIGSETGSIKLSQIVINTQMVITSLNIRWWNEEDKMMLE